MELRYCENCGEVIRLETDEPISLTEQFFCKTCKNESCDTHGDQPRSRPASENPPLSLGGLPATTDLDLFSQQTIVKRKQRSSPTEATLPSDEGRQSTRLRLVKSTAEVGETSDLSFEATEILTPAPDFAEEPVVSPSWLDKAAADQVPTEGRKCYGSTTGSTAPSRCADRLMFRCLHCRAPLAVRPVRKTSRLACPKCHEVLYLTASGRALKGSPSQISRVGGPNSIITRNPGSVVIRKETGSSRKASSSPSASSTNLRLKKSPIPGSQEPDSSRRPEKPAAKEKLNAKKQNDCNLLSVNPSEEWRPKKSSAFDEHRTSDNPNKTQFISEESTGTLQALADNDLLGLGEIGPVVPPKKKGRSDSQRRGGQQKPGAQEGIQRRRNQPVELPSAQQLARHAPSTVACASADKPRIRQVLVRTSLLLVLLAAPIVPAGLLLSRTAHAESSQEIQEPKSTVLEGLGKVASHGIERLFGGKTTPPAK